MQIFDMTMLLIWWLVPLTLIIGRAALQSYRTRQKRKELRELETRITPFTRDL